MTVNFNFPKGNVYFAIEMDFPPRRMEIVNLSQVTKDHFPDESAWLKYCEYEYYSFSWLVYNVIWSPGDNSFVNVILRRKIPVK